MEITLENIRNKLRDSVSSNIIIEGEEFSDYTIEQAIEQALSYWNSSTPIVDSLEYSNVSDIPDAYTEQFMRGIIAVLLTDQALLYSRNRDSGSEDASMERLIQEYKQIGAQYFTSFLQWIGVVKHSLASSGIITASPAYDTPVITLTQATAETSSFTIQDYGGNTLTLSPYTVTLYVKEYMSANSCLFIKELTKTDSTTAELSTESTDFERGGIRFGELVLEESGTVKYRYPVYINIEPALNSSYSREILTVRRLRRVLRDRAGENFIVNDTEFSDADIAKAITEVVSYWNSAPPLLSRYTFTAATFPEEYINAWEEAAAGYALKSLSGKLLSNMINPAETDNQNISQKAEMYRQLGEKKIQFFMKWVQNMKVSLNVSSAWGGKKLNCFG